MLFKYIYRHTNRQTERQRGKLIYRDIETHRQTDKNAYIHTLCVGVRWRAGWGVGSNIQQIDI